MPPACGVVSVPPVLLAVAQEEMPRAQNDVALTGESWEVYGDWTDDASRLEAGLDLRVSAGA